MLSHVKEIHVFHAFCLKWKYGPFGEGRCYYYIFTKNDFSFYILLRPNRMKLLLLWIKHGIKGSHNCRKVGVKARKASLGKSEYAIIVGKPPPKVSDIHSIKVADTQDIKNLTSHLPRVYLKLKDNGFCFSSSLQISCKYFSLVFLPRILLAGESAECSV